MSNVPGISSSSGAYAVDGLGGAAGLSPDALLDYCQSQLGGIDTEISGQIKLQNTELREREAVEQAQTALEAFGTTGPQNGSQMQTCVTAIQQAADSLPVGDPVAAQLDKFCGDMCKQYGFTPAAPVASGASGAALTPFQQQQLANDESIIHQGNADDPAYGQALQDANSLDPQILSSPGTQSGAAPQDPTNPPQNSDWQGTTDALGNIADGIKSEAEIQMLQLQDLVSQRQQAVSLACSMMSKEDSSLEQLSHLGQQ